ncbi:hypothetical protein Scep_016843 [Stephania cephalantha]|uniref:Ribonuclease H1 N-terminal domain-containing protein n=1 Tax=Stephania cephalantha TaxID=152367 RepID=A0AAP0NV35_9MAGN
MAPCKKWYMVFRGRWTGVFNSWDDCSPSVNGYSGNSYKSYQTFEEAYVAFEKSSPRAQEPFMTKQMRALTMNVEIANLMLKMQFLLHLFRHRDGS